MKKPSRKMYLSRELAIAGRLSYKFHGDTNSLSAFGFEKDIQDPNRGETLDY